MLAKRLVNTLLLTLTVLTLITVGGETLLALFSRASYALWTANFLLLTVAVAACIPLALYGFYNALRVTRSYLSE